MSYTQLSQINCILDSNKCQIPVLQFEPLDINKLITDNKLTDINKLLFKFNSTENIADICKFLNCVGCANLDTVLEGYFTYNSQLLNNNFNLAVISWLVNQGIIVSNWLSQCIEYLICNNLTYRKYIMLIIQQNDKLSCGSNDQIIKVLMNSQVSGNPETLSIWMQNLSDCFNVSWEYIVVTIEQLILMFEPSGTGKKLDFIKNIKNVMINSFKKQLDKNIITGVDEKILGITKNYLGNKILSKMKESFDKIVEPSQVEPSQVEPSQVEPSQVEPSQVEPSQVEPSQVEPSQV
jgi:hypothetical protein